MLLANVTLLRSTAEQQQSIFSSKATTKSDRVWELLAKEPVVKSDSHCAV